MWVGIFFASFQRKGFFEMCDEPAAQKGGTDGSDR